MPIIRAPKISSETRQLKRAGPARVAAPAAVAGAGRELDAAGQPDPAEARIAAEVAAQLAQREQALTLKMQGQLVEAMQEAERRGYAAGAEQAELRARAAVREHLERLGAVAVSLSDARAGLLEATRDDLVEIVYSALCRMIGSAAGQPAAAAAMVAQVVAGFQQHEQLVVRVHPQDLALIRQGADALGFKELDASVELRPDPSLRVGGCMVDGPGGTLDARLDTQLASVRDALLAVRKSQERSGGEA